VQKKKRFTRGQGSGKRESGWREGLGGGGGGGGDGGGLGGGYRERLSFGFCRRKNQPPSFPRCRFEAGHGRTRVQSGPAAKRHHRKIRRLFLRGTPAKSKRKPLHHVLRTAGTGRAFEGGALRGGGGGARSCGRGREGSGFGVQGKRSEVRIQRSGNGGVKRRKRGKRGDCRCARWAHWFGEERNSLCARRAQLQNSPAGVAERLTLQEKKNDKNDILGYHEKSENHQK